MPWLLNPSGSDKEAEMHMIGCDLHSRQQTLAILDSETGAVQERVLPHEGDGPYRPS